MAKNAFDKIAKTTDTAPKSSGKVKIAAQVNTEISNKVDAFVANKAELARLEAENKDLESTIIGHVRPQQDDLGFNGSFTKSLVVAGKNSSVTYVTSDRFSVPQDEAAVAEIKNVTGKLFGDMFESKRTISMKDTAAKNEEVLNKVAAACERAGLDIGDIFDVGDKLVAKDALDEKQYQLKKDKLDQFRALVRQSKPALK
jgi:hypothetical protein